MPRRPPRAVSERKGFGLLRAENSTPAAPILGNHSRPHFFVPWAPFFTHTSSRSQNRSLPQYAIRQVLSIVGAVSTRRRARTWRRRNAPATSQAGHPVMMVGKMSQSVLVLVLVLILIRVVVLVLAKSVKKKVDWCLHSKIPSFTSTIHSATYQQLSHTDSLLTRKLQYVLADREGAAFRSITNAWSTGCSWPVCSTAIHLL